MDEALFTWDASGKGKEKPAIKPNFFVDDEGSDDDGGLFGKGRAASDKEEEDEEEEEENEPQARKKSAFGFSAFEKVDDSDDDGLFSENYKPTSVLDELEEKDDDDVANNPLFSDKPVAPANDLFNEDADSTTKQEQIAEEKVARSFENFTISEPEVAAAEGEQSNKEKLTAFYAKYNKAKVITVDETLEKYKGTEHVLWEKLNKAYAKQIAEVPAFS